MATVGKTMQDIDTFSFADTTYKKHIQDKLEQEIVPLLSSNTIMEQLNPYFAQGLKIAIEDFGQK